MAQGRSRPANPPIGVEGFREGSRWIHHKPGGDELAEWFAKNVTIHEGLKHSDYITGIVLIPQKERSKVTGENGQILDIERLTFTPYPTTGARIAYLRDWSAVEAEKREVRLRWEIAADESLARQGHLPGGFFPYNPKWIGDNGKENTKPFVGCSMGLRVYEMDVRSGHEGRLIHKAPCGSKVVPTVGRYGADENALMKAQTGAIGRTLAFAGMLVIPGTGVATAEDVQEAIAGGVSLSGDTGAPAAALPASEPSAQEPEEAKPTDQRAAAAEAIGALQEFPDHLKEIHAWAEERKIDLSQITDEQLRGAVRKLETTLAKARKEKADQPAEAAQPELQA